MEKCYGTWWDTIKTKDLKQQVELLTLKDPFISESCIEIKIELNFMKAFKAFIKPFEAPQRSEKIKI